MPMMSDLWCGCGCPAHPVGTHRACLGSPPQFRVSSSTIHMGPSSSTMRLFFSPPTHTHARGSAQLVGKAPVAPSPSSPALPTQAEQLGRAGHGLGQQAAVPKELACCVLPLLQPRSGPCPCPALNAAHPPALMALKGLICSTSAITVSTASASSPHTKVQWREVGSSSSSFCSQGGAGQGRWDLSHHGPLQWSICRCLRHVTAP